jgi:CRP-like cAMP-binding protein
MEDTHSTRYLPVIQKVSLFQNANQAFLSALALCVEPMHVAANTWIFRAGDEAKDLFFVFDGCVQITIPIYFEQEAQVKKIKKGNYFGDVALFKQEARAVSAYTLVDTDVGRITKQQLDTLLLKFPEIGNCMKIEAEERWRQSIMTSLDAMSQSNLSYLSRKNTQKTNFFSAIVGKIIGK